MNLDDINREYESLEINDLWSAIKGYFLGSMKCILENSDNPNAKLEISSDLDTLIYELEEHVSEMIDNYEAYSIDWDESEKEENLCL